MFIGNCSLLGIPREVRVSTQCTSAISTFQFRSPIRKHNSIPHTPTPPIPRTLTPLHHQLVLLPPLLLLLLHPQLPHMLTTRIPIPNPLTPDPCLPSPRIPPLPNLPFTIEIRECDIKGVYMTGNHASDEEERVDDGVHARACD